MNDLKVFVVDDDVFYLNILEQYLRNLGLSNIRTFDNGSDCLDHIQEKPDVIFLDYHMENLSGYDVLKKIKRYNTNIFIVMISAQEEIKPAIDTLKHGAFDYIQKGNDELDKLKDVLGRIVEVKDLMERNKPSLIKKIFKYI
jgi:DNA-binding NtrC family response regulator